MNYIIVGGYLLVGGAIVFYASMLMVRKWSNSALNDAIPIAVVALVVVLALFFPYWALNGIPGIVGVLRVDANGPLGDFVTGVASPLLQFVLLFYVVRAYYLQKTELKETKNALEEQARVSSNTQFQAFVFQVFEEHRKIKDEINLDGRYADEAFEGLFDRVITNSGELWTEVAGGEKSASAAEVSRRALIQDQCNSVLNDEASGIGRYFRFVYSFARINYERVSMLRKLIVSRDDDRYQHEIDQIYDYMRLYRSMLSNNEKRVLLLNGISTKGHGMITYMREFNLIKNVDVEKYPILHEFSVEFSTVG
ncbi:MAG: hypothetical protein IPI24_13470 [Ignavibacteria bacterium]|nr:hypothetical protein [Ignavibacteria bacterium]MBK9182170.1 hypothetical protein [Ignavibacteria bacterium]